MNDPILPLSDDLVLGDHDALSPQPAPQLRAKRQARRAIQTEAIARTPPSLEEGELAYLAREFIMCTLPHSDPGPVPAWTRTNGVLTLGLQPGYDVERGCSFGLPYGPLPRLLLAWIVTEALRTCSPRLEVGRGLAGFMKSLGLDPYTGRGPRGDATRLREQMRRLFHCLVSFDYRGDEHSRLRVRMLPVESQFHFWEPGKKLDDLCCTIELGQRFYQAITAEAVPLDVRVLKFFKHSPLALDLYSTLSREAFRAQKSGQDRFLAWAWLHAQLGAEYKHVHHFREKCLPQLAAVVEIYPALVVSQRKPAKGRCAGLVVSRHSEPSAPPRRF